MNKAESRIVLTFALMLLSSLGPQLPVNFDSY
jgi:hypothetical protein